jgi:RNA polymerase primary sigma factor
MKLQSKHPIKSLRLPPDDQSVDDADSNWTTWPTMDQDAETVDEEDRTEPVLIESDPKTNSMIAQYFGDVRRYALLTRVEEAALWQRIECLKKRMRRALYTAPVCLPTLQMLWREVVEGERLLQDVIAEPTAIVGDAPAPYAPLEAAILSLQELRQRLRGFETRKRMDDHLRARRARRQEWRDLWRQWIAACEALQLQPGVHEALRQALDTAILDHPDDLALRAALRGWSRANHALGEAKADMLRANLRLVIYVAKRFYNAKTPFLDLIQEGNIGLMRAADKFDPSRGLRFVTYAHWWVRQAIGRAVIEQSRTVRLPNHVIERKSKLRAAESKLWQVHKREPNVQELSAELGWTSNAVMALQDARQIMMRLHEPIFEDGQLLEEVIEDEHDIELDVVVAQRELQEQLNACLNGLSEREAHILRLRFGLETDHAHSLKEIGDLYGLSRERIRQIETIALNKLRASKDCALLADFVDMA